MVSVVLPPISSGCVLWQLGDVAAAPLVGEHDLLAVVAEHRGVPEREVRVGRGVEAHRRSGFEMSTSSPWLAHAPASSPIGRVGRHVVAVARARGRHLRHHRAVGARSARGARVPPPRAGAGRAR
jgi:hypothetical protein